VSILVVDNFSPYIGDILLCLTKLKADYTYKKFYEKIDHEISTYKGVILSGRSKPSRHINVANFNLVRECSLQGTPLLGICYGAEIMALALGGTIRRMLNPLREMSNISLSESPESNIIFQKYRSLNVYESHAYCIARMPDDFVSIAESKHCQNEIIVNLKRKMIGVQFHPEKSREDGLVLFSGFLSM
jgi:GMP synthase (glutamine-hydrolysing)